MMVDAWARVTQLDDGRRGRARLEGGVLKPDRPLPRPIAPCSRCMPVRPTRQRLQARSASEWVPQGPETSEELKQTGPILQKSAATPFLDGVYPKLDPSRLIASIHDNRDRADGAPVPRDLLPAEPRKSRQHTARPASLAPDSPPLDSPIPGDYGYVPCGNQISYCGSIHSDLVGSTLGRVSRQKLRGLLCVPDAQFGRPPELHCADAEAGVSPLSVSTSSAGTAKCIFCGPRPTSPYPLFPAGSTCAITVAPTRASDCAGFAADLVRSEGLPGDLRLRRGHRPPKRSRQGSTAD